MGTLIIAIIILIIRKDKNKYNVEYKEVLPLKEEK
jgi:hypothetical protein